VNTPSAAASAAAALIPLPLTGILSPAPAAEPAWASHDPADYRPGRSADKAPLWFRRACYVFVRVAAPDAQSSFSVYLTKGDGRPPAYLPLSDSMTVVTHGRPARNLLTPTNAVIAIAKHAGGADPDTGNVPYRVVYLVRELILRALGGPRRVPNPSLFDSPQRVASLPVETVQAEIALALLAGGDAARR
jgi:hypothetical protein